MKAIILSAGQGTRLKRYTQHLPKGMLVFNGKTIIERQIELYRKCGVEQIIIIRGFAADKIKYNGVKYYTNEKYATTNMVASLLTAKDEFDDDVIVSYADIIFNEHILRTMIASPYGCCVAVDDNWQAYWQKRYGSVNFDTESLVIDDNDNITSLGLENPPLSEISARYIGLLKFSKATLRHIVEIWEKDYYEYQNKPWQQSGKFIAQAYMTDILQALIENGKPVKAVHFQNGWIEFDTNEDYEKACEWVKDGSIRLLLGCAAKE